MRSNRQSRYSSKLPAVDVKLPAHMFVKVFNSLQSAGGIERPLHLFETTENET